MIEGRFKVYEDNREPEVTKFEVEMTAFMDGEIRTVSVPTDSLDGSEHDLDQIFYWGQNDFQPQPDRCSVSAGDIIRYNGKRWLVAMVGFKEIK